MGRRTEGPEMEGVHAEADGFLPAVVTVNWVRRQWRRTWRVSFDVSAAKGKVSPQTHSGAVRTEGSVSQHSLRWTRK